MLKIIQVSLPIFHFSGNDPFRPIENAYLSAVKCEIIGRIIKWIADLKKMDKNLALCQKDTHSVENCGRDPPPPPILIVLNWNAPFPFHGRNLKNVEAGA